jgi:hypothetical protein
MHFFNIDLHISVIADVRRILGDLGHPVTDWTLSGHAWVFGRQRDPVDVITHQNWQSLEQAMCDAFYERYRDELSGYDGFIVTHTPSFALLYERFGKPIIVIASTRYEHPFSGDAGRWSHFNEALQRLRERGFLVPLANNRYDAAYAKAFTGFDWPVIPSLCEYVEAPATLTQQTYVSFGDYQGLANASPLLIGKAAVRRPPSLGKRILRRLTGRQTTPGYSWQDLAAHRGAVHVPYNASTMSLFEQSTSNLPLFFPTPAYLRQLFVEDGGRTVLSQLSHNQYLGLPPKSAIAPLSGSDPNDFRDVDNVMEWVSLADFYDPANMPHITYFGSTEELAEQLRSADAPAISAAMRTHNVQRRADVYSKWSAVLAGLAGSR